MTEFGAKCPTNPTHKVDEVLRKRFHPGGNWVRYGAWWCNGCERDIEPVFPSRVIADFAGMWSSNRIL